MQQEHKMKAEIINQEDEHWDQVISPKTALLQFDFKELYRYRDLLFLFVKRDFVAQYKQTILGPVWHLLQPLFTTLIFLLIFGRIANIPTDGIEPKILFYMSGITIWNYFSACLTATSTTFVSNASIFGKVYFPRLIMPLSVIMSNLIKFGIQFLLLLGFLIYFGIANHNFYFGASWLLIPVLVAMMALLGLSLGLIVSSLTTKYRDLTVLIGFAVQLLMYAAPVAYPLSFLQGKSYAWLISWNPLTPIIEAFRYAIFGKGMINYAALGYSGGFILLALFIGLVVFNKVEKTFMDTV